jgi:hypothetical protein
MACRARPASALRMSAAAKWLSVPGASLDPRLGKMFHDIKPLASQRHPTGTILAPHCGTPFGVGRAAWHGRSAALRPATKDLAIPQQNSLAKAYKCLPESHLTYILDGAPGNPYRDSLGGMPNLAVRRRGSVDRHQRRSCA